MAILLAESPKLDQTLFQGISLQTSILYSKSGQEKKQTSPEITYKYTLGNSNKKGQLCEKC
jgi:hypothetical protein